jgi:hypothetical protein
MFICKLFSLRNPDSFITIRTRRVQTPVLANPKLDQPHNSTLKPFTPMLTPTLLANSSNLGFTTGLFFAQAVGGTNSFMTGASTAMGYIFIIGAMMAMVGIMAGGFMVMTGKGTETAKMAALGAVIIGGAAALVGGIFSGFGMNSAVPTPTFQ